MPSCFGTRAVELRLYVKEVPLAILLKLGSKFGHVINLKNSTCSVRIYTGIITALSEGFDFNDYASGQLQGAQWDVMACQAFD